MEIMTKVAPLKYSYPFLANIRLGWIFLPEQNTPVYQSKTYIATNRVASLKRPSSFLTKIVCIEFDFAQVTITINFVGSLLRTYGQQILSNLAEKMDWAMS
jgi:hypothetical protein